MNNESTFGEIGVFRNDKRLLTARAMDFTIVYYIKKDHLFKIITNFTKAFQWVHKIQKDLKQNNFKSLKTKCYLCKSYDHLALDCDKYKNEKKGNLKKE